MAQDGETKVASPVQPPARLGRIEAQAAPADVLLRVAEAVAGDVGHAFLGRLVAALRDGMTADLVFITLLDEEPARRARAIWALEDGAPTDGFTYELDDTPCAQVVGGETIVIPRSLETLFPKELGYQGYVGVPLRSDGGRADGHLAVLSRHEVFCVEIAEGVAKIFGQRVEAERRRQRDERRRETLIADLARTNEKLRAQYDATREANAFKTRLLGMIAHDLRNPLAAITAQAELMETYASRPAERVDLERLRASSAKVVSNADRMAAMIDATLNRAHEEASALSLARHAVDLRALVDVATEVNLAAAERKGVTMRVAPGPELIASVDEHLLLEAIDNLISNAVKYGRPGGRVDVVARGDDATAEILVSDDGQGLTAADLERVFGRFQTLSSKPTGGEVATGLGLANVREVVEAHGGTVAAESPGRDLGATFRIRVPRRPGAVDAMVS